MNKGMIVIGLERGNIISRIELKQISKEALCLLIAELEIIKNKLLKHHERLRVEKNE